MPGHHHSRLSRLTLIGCFDNSGDKRNVMNMHYIAPRYYVVQMPVVQVIRRLLLIKTRSDGSRCATNINHLVSGGFQRMSEVKNVLFGSAPDFAGKYLYYFHDL